MRGPVQPACQPCPSAAAWGRAGFRLGRGGAGLHDGAAARLAGAMHEWVQQLHDGAAACLSGSMHVLHGLEVSILQNFPQPLAHLVHAALRLGE